MDLDNGEWLFDISEEDIRESLGRLMQHPEHYGIATPLTMSDLSNRQKRIVIYYRKVFHTIWETGRSGVRETLPPCVVSIVRAAWPDDDQDLAYVTAVTAAVAANDDNVV
jgi:hypothetical protein